ncbi:oxidoreductase family protein [Rutstroemia sp. NJR-2017a BBW]|nr:oxidoreductase family protein [Rutstroemia sp. NJR-2017a BBW]
MVGLQGRYDPLVQKVKKILDEGKIGKIMSSTVTVCSSALPVGTWLKDLEFYLDWNSGGNEYTIFIGHFLDSFTYLLGDFASVLGLLACQYPSVTIIDPTTGQIVNPAYPKTAPDHVCITGTLQSSAVASLTFRKTPSAADSVGFRWYITGAEGEITITTEEGNWQGGGIREKRKISLKVGKEDSIDVEFGKDDNTLAEKVAFPATNTARQYEAFAAGDGEVVTFEDGLRNHRLLQRISNSSGWEMI